MHIVLVDPVPDAREMSAKAFGRLVGKLGEESFPDLVDSLMDILQKDVSGVDRQGAAQGLSEILGGLGIERFAAVLPHFLKQSSSPNSYCREGFLLLVTFLPITFGGTLSRFLPSIVTTSISSLGDEYDNVRESGMKACRNILKYIDCEDLFLQSLEHVLFSDNWRIRQSSAQLMGELFNKINGFSREFESKRVISRIGADHYNDILASLYFLRSDEVIGVRNSSSAVWKQIISNTPRTLREIFNNILNLLIKLIGEPSRFSMAYSTLEEILKLGDFAISRIVPLFSDYKSIPIDQRGGVCLIVSVTLENCSFEEIEKFSDEIMNSLKLSILDFSSVRESSARLFEAYSALNPKAVDVIIPYLVNNLTSNENALEALKEIVGQNSDIFQILLPQLVSKPLTVSKSEALAGVISVAGSALNRHIVTVMEPVLESNLEDKNAINVVKEIVRSVDQGGLRFLTMFLQDSVKTMPSQTFKILKILYSFRGIDEYTSEWIRTLVVCLSANEECKEAFDCLECIISQIPKNNFDFVGSAMRAMIGKERIIGFEKYGINSLLPVFLNGLLYGSSDVRENAASGIGYLISLGKMSQSNCTMIAGHLIRIFGEKAVSDLCKLQILKDLKLLLKKEPNYAKPFFPQIQRTFVKSLSENNNNFNSLGKQEAQEGLVCLLPLLANKTPLVKELEKICEDENNFGYKESYELLKNL
jgi:hypothetical protein